MSIRKIESRITGYAIKNNDEPAATPEVQDLAAAPQGPSIVEMNESIPRPELLLGSTYKIKAPGSEHAMYITINDMVLNEGTEYEERRPFELFINSKNMDQFQWVVALTRIISAVFRKGGDVQFLVEELKAVFDPKGGYWKPGTGMYVPSLIAEIGLVIEDHLKRTGVMAKPQLDPAQQALIAQKRQEFEQKSSAATDDSPVFPANATLCSKCQHKAVVIMDGCATCLNCGNSKCG